MPSARTHSSRNRSRFRPAVDRLETLCLLSTVDLTGSSVGVDVVRAVGTSTPRTGRQSVALKTLSADDATDLISGTVLERHKFAIIGTVTTTVRFKTSIESPKPGDVQVTLDRFNGFLSSSARTKVAKAVANVIRRDHDAIVALVHPTKV